MTTLTKEKESSQENKPGSQGIPYEVYLAELKERLDKLEERNNQLTTHLNESRRQFNELGKKLVDILETLAKQPGIERKEKELFFQKFKDLEERQNQLLKTEQIPGEKRDLEGVAAKLDKKIEEKIESSLQKTQEEAVQQQVERMADKLQDEESAPSGRALSERSSTSGATGGAPKKKPGILAVLNDLLIGEDEE